MLFLKDVDNPNLYQTLL